MTISNSMFRPATSLVRFGNQDKLNSDTPKSPSLVIDEMEKADQHIFNQFLKVEKPAYPGSEQVDLATFLKSRPAES